MIGFIKADPRFAIEVLLGVLGIVVGFYLYYRGTFVKLPCSSQKSKILIDPSLVERNPIKVTFNDEQVTTLTITRIALWNNGRATIQKADIAEGDPLRVVAKTGCQILAADLFLQTHPANRFEVDLDRAKNEIAIEFDFMDHKNGAIIGVYHAGLQEDSLEIRGTIKGVTRIYDRDRSGRRLANLFQWMDDRLERLFMPLIRRIPLKVLEWGAGREPGCRGFILYMLMLFPSLLILGPFFVLVMIVVVPAIMFLLPFGLIEAFRFAMPKELYSVME